MRAQPPVLNRKMIAGSALVVAVPAELEAGRSYSWRDSLPTGKNVTLLARRPSTQRPKQLARACLCRTGSQTLPLALMPREAASLVRPKAVPLWSKPRRSCRPAVARQQTPTLFSSQLIICPTSRRAGDKDTVKREGWYRVTQQELVAAGWMRKSILASYNYSQTAQSPLPMLVTADADGRLTE